MMWTDYLIENKAIKAIFGDKEPSLERIHILEISHLSPTNIDIVFELNVMPDPLPKRWAANRAKVCVIGLSFYNKDNTPIFNYANLNIEQNNQMTMEIEMESTDKKRVVIRNLKGVSFIELKADFLNILKFGYK